jgi:hypothetical protein
MGHEGTKAQGKMKVKKFSILVPWWRESRREKQKTQRKIVNWLIS